MSHPPYIFQRLLRTVHLPLPLQPFKIVIIKIVRRYIKKYQTITDANVRAKTSIMSFSGHGADNLYKRQPYGTR
jgi:hypothetical protein